MKIIVVGLGSMGRRRIRLIKQYDDSIDIVGIDKSAERREQSRDEFGIDVCDSVEHVLDNSFECAFVCASPLAHRKLISFFVKNNINVFTEINLVSDGYDEFINEEKVKIFLSSTFLYRNDIQWIIDRVMGQRVNYMYHTGQYLPDWHPWENYKDFFVGNKKTNGCREIMAIEFPWLLKCFGKIKTINVKKDKMTDLKIDYPDNYMLTIEHENGNKGLIFVDIVSRTASRRIEIFNESLHIFWDGTPDSLREWKDENKVVEKIDTYGKVDNDDKYAKNIIENAYYDEICAFFKWLKGDKSDVKHSFEADLEVLKLIDEIEE